MVLENPSAADDMLRGSSSRGDAGCIRLDRLQPMLCATVSKVDAAGGGADQLMAMGVCVGRKVEVVKHGDPLILRVLGSRIGVSARLASRVFVDVCAEGQCQPTGST